MTIIEPFSIFPDNEFYMLQKTVIGMKLFALNPKDSKLGYDELKLPHFNYDWKIDDATIGKVEQSGKLSTNEKLGSAQITVSDSRATNNSIAVRVHVVQPFRMRLLITKQEKGESFWEKWVPFIFKRQKREADFDNNWNLVKGDSYYIQAEVFDEFGNKITITDSTSLKVESCLPSGRSPGA